MKAPIYLTAIAISLLSCANTTSKDDKNQSSKPDTIKESIKIQKVQYNNLLTLPDAEKILGEQAHLTDSSTSGADPSRFSSAYFANEKDTVSGKTGCIYFLVEEFRNVLAAEKKYSFIKKANEDHGIKTLKHLGDEAYFHSDNRNFYFVMVRKGKKVFNMKVNKITSKTSLDEFNNVAKKITDEL